jgi:ATP-binding cassette subfamily F protein 1
MDPEEEVAAEGATDAAPSKTKSAKSKKMNKLDMLGGEEEQEEEVEQVTKEKKGKRRGKKEREKPAPKSVIDKMKDMDLNDSGNEDDGEQFEQRYDYDSEEEKEKEETVDEPTVKLSRKEKKKAAKQAKYDAESSEMEGQEGSQFSLSQQQNTTTGDLPENATAIKTEKFSIAARGKDLFINASLNITQGRRYGLVGPNGMGKTTLLVHIARRQLAIPPNIDVLLCEQDIQVDDTPAVEMVLKADKKRLELIAEEQHLLKAVKHNHGIS